MGRKRKGRRRKAALADLRNPARFRSRVRQGLRAGFGALKGLLWEIWIGSTLPIRTTTIRLSKAAAAVKQRAKNESFLTVPEMTNKQIRESSMFYLTWLEFRGLFLPLLGPLGAIMVVAIWILSLIADP